jgi:hypothetical protein
MKYVAGIALIGALSFAEQPPKPVLDAKPVCRAANTGQLWPEAANLSPEAGREFFRRGELEMCSSVKSTFGTKYKWERLSVSARDLAKAKKTRLTSSN